ncbi:MAG: 2-oxoacid:ferredoxin oxidoreductase subunit beta [Dehalococcoidia bacterium]|nr:2-oxoacid:ferredoxin oxidoreductase subunit beta [Dehalococcoidia bacterium]
MKRPLADKEESMVETLLRLDRIPHIWCAGCGIGPAVTCFIRAINRTDLDPDKLALISGIGCSGRVAGYVRLDSFHTTHGRALPFATGLKLGNPELKVVVFSGDGDLVAIGGNHLIHSARRNMDMTVICINNFNYGMTGGQAGPTTPLEARSTTTPFGNLEYPFNVPDLVAASGAPYVARWTVLHARQLERSIAEALAKPGFSFIEIIAPCPTLYGRMNKMPQGLDAMRYYQEKSVVRNGADPRDVALTPGGSIIVGKFVDINRPTFCDQYQSLVDKVRARHN